MATHKDIFGASRNEVTSNVASSDEAASPSIGAKEIMSLKKQLNYINFSKADVDPINSKPRTRVYKEYNKHVYQYEDERRNEMDKAREIQSA